MRPACCDPGLSADGYSFQFYGPNVIPELVRENANGSCLASHFGWYGTFTLQLFTNFNPAVEDSKRPSNPEHFQPFLTRPYLACFLRFLGCKNLTPGSGPKGPK